MEGLRGRGFLAGGVEGRGWAQLIRRDRRNFLWTRGEELVTPRYPEIEVIGDHLPEGTVIDGELLPWKAGAPLPFAQLQRRIGRKAVTKKIMEEVPVVLVGYDLLEYEGKDIRAEPLETRWALLDARWRRAAWGSGSGCQRGFRGRAGDELAKARDGSRARGAEGLMLKRLDSAYGVGRQRGVWWKWKVDPLTVDAVLTAARRGSGKRASLYTDYTFAVWDGDRLVPIAQAYSGLTDAEIRRLDAWIRRHMVEKFGPVCTVSPELVFELGFEGIRAVEPASVRGGGAVSADLALAGGQARAGGRYAGDDERASGGG